MDFHQERDIGPPFAARPRLTAEIVVMAMAAVTAAVADIAAAEATEAVADEAAVVGVDIAATAATAAIDATESLP